MLGFSINHELDWPGNPQKMAAIILCLVFTISVQRGTTFTAGSEYIWEGNNHTFKLLEVGTEDDLFWVTASDEVKTYGL